MQGDVAGSALQVHTAVGLIWALFQLVAAVLAAVHLPGVASHTSPLHPRRAVCRMMQQQEPAARGALQPGALQQFFGGGGAEVLLRHISRAGSVHVDRREVLSTLACLSGQGMHQVMRV